MSAQPISRRDFLKFGCAASAAAGLAVCSINLAVPIPDPSTVILPAYSYGEMTMNNSSSVSRRILVTYASAMGSTAGVAAEIGKTLAAGGFVVDVSPIKDHPQVDGYQAILIGSAVQHGNWLLEAVEFVKANQAALNHLAVALFCVHITNLGDDETSRKNRLAYLDAVRPLLQPVSEAFFAGKFDRRGAVLMIPGWFARLVPPLDFRNWEKIRAWANQIAPSLQ